MAVALPSLALARTPFRFLPPVGEDWAPLRRQGSWETEPGWSLLLLIYSGCLAY